VSFDLEDFRGRTYLSNDIWKYVMGIVVMKVEKNRRSLEERLSVEAITVD
jgi:hypothetical protein